MKQKIETILLRSLMESDDGHGREQGIAVHTKLLALIEQSSSLLFSVSLKNVRRLDASFPRESIMEIVRRYKGDRGICLTEVTNPDLIDNLDAAALKKEIPMFIWNDNEYQIIGKEPKLGLKAVLELALSKPSITAAEVAKELELKLNNASMKLKQLVTEGLLVRQEEIAPSGGKEFYYYRIK
ncbi:MULTISPECIES: DNA-binding protein [unclassified Oceanispirochaeta]|uniref:DNA-binding protein n=1 Tax=unclassified Oceanispirochaeta TaxID=2635722 RepID=UPI0011C038E8|nr:MULTISPECIES: DNA-binding protein [unclassified Oceanispirochaeta]MBF9016729.1 DNA-binding protein [Oceanispirochaeta sp. M2]NPD71999.1 DNA-binding protein [Oceanispirochaeta sp. M1]